MTDLNDGLGTTLVLEESALVVNKIRITPPAVEGGDTIPLTHLGNVVWETGQPRQLKRMENFSFEGVYDPSKLVDAPVNVNQRIRIEYPGGGRHRFFGSLRRFEPGEIVEGARCMVTGTIEVLNTDTAGDEAGPIFYAATETLTGTATT